MAVRLFLRDAQTEPGTGGTVYDLSGTQGTGATLDSGDVVSDTFAEVLRFQQTVDDTIAGSSFDTSVDMASVTGTGEWRWRIQRIDSGGTVQASSAYSASFTDAGIKTATLALATSWQAGDRLALSIELRAATAPDPPTAVTSIAADASATVSFLAPADTGTGPVTQWVVTPYDGSTPETPTTVDVGDAGSIDGSDGNTYVQCDVTGLTNSTDYTFTVIARSAYGDSAESDASGVNTPLSGLVFGDHFNGPAGGPIDPEWWVYNLRCGYLAQNEKAAYMATHCVLDGSGNLKLTAENVDTTVPRYPSDPLYPGNITQPWRSGACQSNTKTWAPSSGNTMTFEVKLQVNPNAGSGYWPGLFWLNGQSALAWPDDPDQGGWNDNDHSEFDVAEWFPPTTPSTYLNNAWISSTPDSHTENSGIDLSAAMHVYKLEWKPGVRATFYRDGSQTFESTSDVPSSSAAMVLLIYLQMLSGGPSNTESCFIDYVRIYDQNLG